MFKSFDLSKLIKTPTIMHVGGKAFPTYRWKAKPEDIRALPPKKTVTSYKLFRVNKNYPGKLFPLFVDSNAPIPFDEWVEAKAGEPDPKSPGHVKSKLGPLAYRPGFHAGRIPVATHIGLKDESDNTKPAFRNPDYVWAEVTLADDIDWQSEAVRRATRGKDGNIIARTAHITDRVPYGGYYSYKTNSNMTGEWMISGTMKINRVLSDEEVKKINGKAGFADLPRTKPLNLSEYGFNAEGKPSEPVVENGHEFKRAGKAVDGLEVLDDIPNTDSISASLNEYEVLPGIREVPMSAFSDPDPYKNYYAADDIDRTYRLAEAIKQSGQIKPLIVVIDKEGPYILEGGHRWSALGVIGKKSFPALVVMDTEERNVEKSLTFSGFPLQGRRKIHGMDISIENKKGSTRRGKDKDGHKWATKMNADYGYIRGTVGKDKDHLDCYVGPNPESTRVFIVHQNDPTTGNYDEDKTLIGFDTAEEAKALYMKQYDRPGFFGSMDETDIETFKAKAFADNAKGKKLVIKAIRKDMGREYEVGVAVEMEHTDDPKEAAQIARDHLKETPDYYSRLLAAGLIDEPKALAIAKETGMKKSAPMTDSFFSRRGDMLEAVTITLWQIR